ncbi:MAG: lysophospholipid acyltransferase family protein [Chthoniobacterales bacterium]|nr:lysophospholipid acyltransferase family protein [Chthoniobacterales bacterium]
MKKQWKRIRYRLEWLAVKLAMAIVPLFSRDGCYRFAGFAGTLAARFDKRGRAVALANLEAAFGDTLTSTQREAVAVESYQHFARAMLDLFWSPRLDAQNFTRYVEHENIGRARAEIAPSGSCIVGTFHYGNFEWLGLASAWLGFPCAITTQEFKNPLLGDLFKALREQSGHRVVEREGAIIRLYKVLRKKGRAALLVDTTLPPHHPTVVIDCFGLKTIVTVAHAWLQERTGVPIIPVHCEPLESGRYKLVAHPKVQPPKGATHQQIAQACWDAMEPTIRQNPAPWLWMYKHWRYRPTGASGYPFYAQESPAFDQIASRPDYAKLDRSVISWPGQNAA